MVSFHGFISNLGLLGLKSNFELLLYLIYVDRIAQGGAGTDPNDTRRELSVIGISPFG